MKIITCFIPQTEGSVSVCGYDVVEQSIEVRKNVGYLPEHNPLYLDMYVKEYLHFIGGLHKMSNNQLAKRVPEMIDSVGLQVEQNKKIGALSKGYRQRVGLAQALIHNPNVLILDEPTTGLDPNQLAEIRELIRSVGKEKTVMLSTHIMQEVKAICDRVIIINKGEIVADETTAVLQQQKGSEIIVTVEFDKAVSTTDLNKIEGVISAQNTSGNTWKIKSADGKDIRSILFKWAVENNLSVLTMQREEQSLEDVFLKLTK